MQGWGAQYRGNAQRASWRSKFTIHSTYPRTYLLTFLTLLTLPFCLSTQAALLARRRDGAGWRVQGESAPPTPHAWREASPLRWPERSVVTLGPLEIKTFKIVTKPALAVRVAAA